MPVAATQADALRVTLSGVRVRHLAAVGAVPGVAPLAAAARNGPGTGRLSGHGSGTLLSWKAPGSAADGPKVACAADGDYLLSDGQDRGKWLRVRVSASHLVPGPARGAVVLADVYNNGVGHADVTASEAMAGDVTAYTVGLTNDGTVVLSRLVVWLDPATAGLEMSDDGLAWVGPTTEATALALGDLAPGSSHTLHLRRTVAAASPPDAGVLNHLHARFDGL